MFEMISRLLSLAVVGVLSYQRGHVATGMTPIGVNSDRFVRSLPLIIVVYWKHREDAVRGNGGAIVGDVTLFGGR